MSVDLYIHVGSFIHFPEGIEIEETTTTHTCPVCKKQSSAKFCSDDGAEIVTKSKTKTKKLVKGYEILNHVTHNKEEFEDLFMAAEYGPAGVIVPNRRLKFSETFNDTDTVFLTSGTGVLNMQDSLAEFRIFAKDFLRHLDSRGYNYTWCHGIVTMEY